MASIWNNRPKYPVNSYAERPALVADQPWPRLLSPAPQRGGTQCARRTGSISARDRDGIQSERTRACRPNFVLPSRLGQRDQASSSRLGCGKNSCGDRGLSSRALSRGIRSRYGQGTPGNRSDLRGSAALYGRTFLRSRARCDADEALTLVHGNSLGFRGVSGASLLRECPFVAHPSRGNCREGRPVTARHYDRETRIPGAEKVEEAENLARIGHAGELETPAEDEAAGECREDDQHYSPSDPV